MLLRRPYQGNASAFWLAARFASLKKNIGSCDLGYIHHLGSGVYSWNNEWIWNR
ncbi:MAG: hypothetical protein IPN51_12935 [Chloracidobacterium sp.]|nr:hypothetical protein [Chloracidobacterium sp.]